MDEVNKTYRMEGASSNVTNMTIGNLAKRPYHYIPTWYIAILLFIGLFGMLGNAMTIIVILKRKIWTSVNLLIGIMSVSDFCVIPLVASVAFQSYLAQHFYTLNIPANIRHAFMTSSIVSAVIIGCERAFAVRHPLKYKEKWTTKLTLKIYVATYIVFLSLVMTRPLISSLLGRDFFEKHLYVAYFFIVRGFPFVIILVTNFAVVRGLMANSKHIIELASESMDRQRIKTETAITRTVLVLTTVYFLCMVPSRILLGLATSGFFVGGNALSMLLICILEMTNFSVNMVIYTMTSKVYRKEYTKLLASCFCWARRTQSRERQTESSQQTISYIYSS